MSFRFVRILLVASFLLSFHAVAGIKLSHDHEDLFGEEDLLLGFKLGPQVSGYTSYQTPGATVSVQSAVRGAGGLAIEFLYGFPRFELDLFLNSRTAINSSDSVYSLSIPVLAKAPIGLDEEFEIEVGAGYQGDALFGGADPHRGWLSSVLGSVALMRDLKPMILCLEFRYVFGFDTLDNTINGAKNREAQMLGGLLWHF